MDTGINCLSEQCCFKNIFTGKRTTVYAGIQKGGKGPSLFC